MHSKAKRFLLFVIVVAAVLTVLVLVKYFGVQSAFIVDIGRSLTFRLSNLLHLVIDLTSRLYHFSIVKVFIAVFLLLSLVISRLVLIR